MTAAARVTAAPDRGHHGPVTSRADVRAPDGPAPGAVADLTALVSRLGERVFSDIERLREVAEEVLAPGQARREDLAPLEPVVDELLTGPDPLGVGAGYVAAPGALADQPYWLEWWTVPSAGAGPRRRLVVDVDPAGEAFRDYTALPWFRVPRDAGRGHVTGPYVDYLCTDEYTLTFTTPVVAGGVFAGVVGIDVYVRDLEQRTLGALQAVGEPAVLVNRQGRVVAGNADVETGQLLRTVDVDALWDNGSEVDGTCLTVCGDLPLAVVTGAALTR